jgi:hypothetical protein
LTHLELLLTEHFEILGDGADDDSVHVPSSSLTLDHDIRGFRAEVTGESFETLFCAQASHDRGSCRGDTDISLRTDKSEEGR